MKTYEAIFIFLSSLSEEDTQKTLQRVTAELTKQGGVVKETLPMGRRTFARPMKKEDSGFYYKMRFEIDPLHMEPLQARLKLIEEIFRVQITVAPANRPAAPAPAGEAAAAAPAAKEA